jgi:putative methyltransferase
LETVVQHFVSEGWVQIDQPESDNDSNPDGFYLDAFVPNLLVFPVGTQFQSHPMYLDGSIILQDKASCLPPLALKPRKGRAILDACAAPGMKTSLLASLIEKDGIIYAIEKGTKRFETLKRMMELYGINSADKHCVQPIHNDFTNINPEDSEYKDVEYILVDPSCSGSGMTGRVETDLQLFQSNESSTQQDERLQTLSYFQTKLLCHAMKFPNVKRIVYSTCSLYSQENEDVVAAALEYNNNSSQDDSDRSHRRIFRVKEALPDWPHRLENQNYDWASKCITSSLQEDGTDGFFVAVLERVKSKR